MSYKSLLSSCELSSLNVFEQEQSKSQLPSNYELSCIPKCAEPTLRLFLCYWRFSLLFVLASQCFYDFFLNLLIIPVSIIDIYELLDELNDIISFDDIFIVCFFDFAAFSIIDYSSAILFSCFIRFFYRALFILSLSIKNLILLSAYFGVFYTKIGLKFF